MSSQQPGLHPFGWLFAIMLRKRHAPQIPREKARARRLVRLMRRRIFQLQLQDGRFQEQQFQRYESTILDIPPERWPRIFADPAQQPLYAERRLASIHNLNMAMDVWFNAVPDAVEFNERYTSMPKASLPVKGARMVIVPHGEHLLHSGETAAYAYKALDISRAKTIVVLCDIQTAKGVCGLALPEPSIKSYRTPVSPIPLKVDEKRHFQLRLTGKFQTILRANEQREPAFEMQSVWLRHLFRMRFGDDFTRYPKVLPIYVGQFILPEICGKEVLQDLFSDPEVSIIVSADLNRWGGESGNIFYSKRARTLAMDVPVFTKYLPQPDTTTTPEEIRDEMMWLKVAEKNISQSSSFGARVARYGTYTHNPPLYEAIASIDHMCLRALTMSPAHAFATFLQIKQLLSIKCHLSGALCMALCVLESKFGREARSRSRSPLSPQSSNVKGGRDPYRVSRSPARPVVCGQDLNTLPWEIMSRTSKLKMVALLRERRYLLRGRPVMLRYDRNINTDSVANESHSFFSAYVVMD